MRALHLSKIAVLACSVLLGGCSLFSAREASIPTPIAANPAALRIAVLAPEQFHIGKDDLVLKVFQGDITGNYTLISTDAAAAQAAIARFTTPGQVLHLYRLSPADALALRDQQYQMAEARSGGGAKPGFSVDLDKACWKGPVFAPGVPLDVLIEASDDDTFHPLLSDIDIFELLNRSEETRLKPCKA